MGSPSDFLAITRDEMVQNAMKVIFKYLVFKRRFIAHFFFCTNRRLFVPLGSRLLVTRLAVHSFTDHWVSPSFKNSKPRLQRQRTRVQWLRMSALECFAHFLCHSVHKPTTWNYHILRIRGENVKYEGQIKKKIVAVKWNFLRHSWLNIVGF